MTDMSLVESTIVNTLQSYLANVYQTCTVVMANQTAPIPEYPYVSYTIITPMVATGGTYGIAADGTRYKTIKQVWSFTVQSDNDAESKSIAFAIYTWFSLIGRVDIEDCGIIAESISNVSNRDNLLTVEYEYRNGLDVTFTIAYTVTKQEANRAGCVQQVNVTRR